uniref:Chitin-binding type-2 domain-containing protein n=1 Tax=Glossina morsitans morsitans TaxID=37546 RepID=A0A1B0G2E1_GLOMM
MVSQFFPYRRYKYFRFLCPNGTAFDQEAQICANWGDVDCDQSVLYYGSDNFDLYRLGSGYESKRAPAAEEDESTFHLQRAESGDIRRFNERRIDQKSRPDQPPNYTKHFETVTRNTVNHIASTNYKEGPKRKSETTKRPIVSYYTPTSTTTEHYDESKQEFDDFLKGSHSSNFFVNRNGGHEEDYLEHSRKLKPNDFSDFNKKSESTTIGKSRVSTIKIKRPLQQSSGDFNLITTPTSPKTTKRVTIQAYSNTPSSATISTTTVKPLQNSFNKINFGSNDYETQAKIQPTTYNPNRLKSTTIKYNELKRDKAAALDSYQNKGNYQNKPISGNSRKVQKFEEALQKSEDFNNFKEFSRAKPQQPQPFKSQKPIKTLDDSIKTEPQYQRTRSQSVRGNNQQPAPFSAPQRQTASKTVDFNKTKLAVNNDSKPRGFANRGKINFKASTQYDYYENYRTTTSDQKKFSTLVAKDKYTPTTFKPIKKTMSAPQPIKPQNLAHKSTNTLAKTNIEPTTASPYYNPDEDDGQYHPELYELDYSRNRFNLQRSTSTTGTVTKQEALSDFSDEDDLFKTAQSLNFGAASINKLRADIIKAEKTSQQYNSQYNPHNSYFASPNSTTTSAPKHTSTTLNYYTQPSTYSSTQTSFKPNAYAENFIFTSTTSIRPPIIAHSSSTTTTTTTSPHPPPAFYKKSEKSANAKSSKSKGQSSKKTSKRPPHADEDTSYDYAYYDTDTLSESPQEYQDYEIAEFARTRKN